MASDSNLVKKRRPQYLEEDLATPQTKRLKLVEESDFKVELSEKNKKKLILVPIMLFASSMIMAMAWLGHLHFKNDISFITATFFAWLLVLPEYTLNIIALRFGHPSYSGGQMAAFRLSSGVACVAFVSHYVLGEVLGPQKLVGFAVMIMSMLLISSSKEKRITAVKEEV